MTIKNSSLLRGWNALSDAWRWPVMIWAGMTAFLWGWWAVLQKLGFIRATALSQGSPAWLQTWNRSDTFFYLNIAQAGYDKEINSLFYPLYPLLGRWVHNLTGLPELGAFLILSHVFTLVSLLALYRLAEPLYGMPFARRVVFAAAVFPTSFYFWAGYPQSLVLMLLLLTWLFIRRRWWVAACITGFAAGLSHSTGLFAVLPLVVEGFQAIGSAYKQLLRWTFIIPAAFPAFGVAVFWSWRIHAGFGAYDLLQYIHFQRITRFPWQTFIQAVKEAFSPAVVQVMPRVNLVVLIILLLSIVWGIKRLPLVWNIYLASAIILGLSASCQVEALWSFSRIILIVFPIYFAIAGWMGKPRIGSLLIAVLLSGWLLLSAIFLAGAWVA